MNAQLDMERGRGVRGRLCYDEPMASHTAWAVGGPADCFFEPADGEDLNAFIARLPADEPIFWLGLGSNLLVRDGGIEGTVIATGHAFKRLERLAGERVRVEAGVPCAKVARFCAREGLSGGEFLAGIPGTMGGALAMNAGAFGGDTWSIVRRVESIDRLGARHIRSPRDYRIGYRQVEQPADEWFVAAELELAPGDPATGQAEIKALLKRRGDAQPMGTRSCGSVFRNPPDDHAARLIEASGLKGKRIGGAVVSPKHANFILNQGQASAADLEALIELVGDVVEREHGVRLLREVRIVGRAAGERS